MLETPTGTLHGTLLVPSGEEPYPVAVIVAGSGPTDRDGNSTLLPGPNNSLRLLAEGLAEGGVASLRFDKRGVAESAGAGTSEADLRFETYVDDVSAWIALLRADERFTSVSVVGHSEGALIGLLAAGEVDAFVSVSGIARRSSDVIRDQLRPQLPPALWEASERILAALEREETEEDVPDALATLYRPSVQPYLISWFRYAPADEVSRLDVPVLVVQGTTDLQVDMAEAEALKAAQPDAELFIVEGMNHVLKLVPNDQVQQQASYSDPSLPIAPGLAERISRFVREHAPD